MKPIETVAVIGLGAIGACVFTQILGRAEPGSLFVVAGGERAEKLRRDGVIFNGERYGVPVAEPGCGKTADLLIFAVKANQLTAAIEDARGFVADGTVILSLLNGINSEKTISDAYNTGHTLYSYAVGTDATRTDGGIRCSKMLTIPFGEETNDPANPSEAVAAVRGFFDRTGMPYAIPEDMRRSMWWKYMMNMGVNQTLAVLRLPYSALQRRGYAREIALGAMRETAAVARRLGIALADSDAEDAMAVVDTISPDGQPSTLQDVLAKRVTEIEIFSGALLETARTLGLELPVNALLYRQVKALEESYC
ncbi:MAG: ketopantoate reductase family protein [Oscillospiraceae bacterium]|jgi:2-dehydropantoate 2-reductase|nr:ketopantoate reductase family protein [Oscillospiraceae bacterium]